MKIYNYWQSKISLMFVILLLALLPTLAVLQYRWLGQVSLAERERMQVSLRTAANNFTNDFDREITHIFFGLQNLKINSETNSPKANELEQKYAEAYQQWLATSRHPQLIKGLYFVDLGQEKQELLKFSPESASFQPSDWPLELTKLKENWQNCCNTSQVTTSKNFEFHTDIPIFSEIPAIVIPRSNPFTIPRIALDAPKPNADIFLNFKMSSTYVIALLDLTYIQQQWLPALTNRYFSIDNQIDYYVAVVNSNSSTSMIYQSSQQFTKEQLSNNDIKLNFFSLNPEELEKFIFLDVNASQTKHPPNTLVKQRTETIKSFQQNNHSATIRIVESSSLSSNKTNKPATVKMLGVSKTKENLSSPWQLIVKHRDGSLDAAVGSLRKRNLAVSFGILLLLTISMGMILISTRRAQSLAKQQMEFVAGVSHELRTPLAVICSAGENLADGVVNKPEQIKRYGSLIKGEGRRLTDMVEQILEFAGWQSHKKTYHLQPTSVNSMIENAISACNPLINETNTEIVTDIEPNLPLINVDPGALERATQNLICNAIKYSGEIKWLKITAKYQPITSQVEINIIDKGIGISAKELPYIFEPFYRGQEVIEAQIHGSGLGLSLVKQIVTACKGKITVTSTVNQGSTFTLYLPVANAKQIEIKSPSKIEIYE